MAFGQFKPDCTLVALLNVARSADPTHVADWLAYLTGIPFAADDVHAACKFNDTKKREMRRRDPVATGVFYLAVPTARLAEFQAACYRHSCEVRRVPLKHQPPPPAGYWHVDLNVKFDVTQPVIYNLTPKELDGYKTRGASPYDLGRGPFMPLGVESTMTQVCDCCHCRPDYAFQKLVDNLQRGTGRFTRQEAETEARFFFSCCQPLPAVDPAIAYAHVEATPVVAYQADAVTMPQPEAPAYARAVPPRQVAAAKVPQRRVVQGNAGGAAVNNFYPEHDAAFYTYNYDDVLVYDQQPSAAPEEGASGRFYYDPYSCDSPKIHC